MLAFAPAPDVGGQVGYGTDSVRWRNLGASTFFSPLNSGTRDSGSGVIGGGQLGYNFQYNRLVFGIEADGSGLSGRASIHCLWTVSLLRFHNFGGWPASRSTRSRS